MFDSFSGHLEAKMLKDDFTTLCNSNSSYFLYMYIPTNSMTTLVEQSVAQLKFSFSEKATKICVFFLMVTATYFRYGHLSKTVVKEIKHFWYAMIRVLVEPEKVILYCRKHETS